MYIIMPFNQNKFQPCNAIKFIYIYPKQTRLFRISNGPLGAICGRAAFGTGVSAQGAQPRVSNLHDPRSGYVNHLNSFRTNRNPIGIPSKESPAVNGIYTFISYLPIKVLGVLSYHNCVFACAQRFQFHRTQPRDSVTIVQPFMRDTNYVSRDFATLELLELQLPFAFAVGQATDTIH